MKAIYIKRCQTDDVQMAETDDVHKKHFLNSVLTGPTYKLINIKTLPMVRLELAAPRL